jgi:hypothetical protein
MMTCFQSTLRAAVRWGLLAGAIALGACYSGAIQPSDNDAGSVCDGKETCNECLSCARANPCAPQLDSCLNNSACVNLNDCLDLCGGDLGCQQDCYTGNQQGIAAYNALADCLYCDQCPGDCAGFRDCT